MKSQIKRFSKSTLSVILSLCMLVSCMTVGLIATDAAMTAQERVGAVDNSEPLGYTSLANKTIYFDNTNTSYGTVYVYLGHDSFAKSYTMTNTGSHNIWKITFDSNTEWTDRTKLYFASRSDSPNGQNFSIDTQHGWPGNNQKTNLITANDADGGSCFFPAGNSNSNLTRHPIRVVAGDLSSNGWDNKADLMSYSSSQHTYQYTNVAAGEYSLAVVGFDDWSTSYRWAAKGTLTANNIASWADANDNDNNIKLTTTSKSNITITLTSSNKVNITVSPITYNITFSQPSNGSIKINNSTSSPVAINHGSNVSIVVTPNSGYKIMTLTDNSSAVSAAVGKTSAYTYTISNVTAAHTIAATMEAANTQLAAPTNVALALSIVTATPNSTVRLSWTSVANAGSYKVYLDGTLKQTVTTAYYDIDQKASSAGDYTVVAVPSSAASYSESDPSSAVKLTVDKTSLPTPAVTINPLDIASGSSTTATFSNYSSLSSYISGGYATLTRGTRAYGASGGAFTTNTAVTSTSGSETLSPTSSIQYAYYMAVTATGSEYYYQSGNSAFYDVYVASASWYLIGDISGNWTDEKSDYKLTSYNGDNIFYYVYTATGSKYFSFSSGGTRYNPKGATYDSPCDVTSIGSQEDAVELESNNASSSFHISTAGTYVIYINQTNNTVWVEQNTRLLNIYAYTQTFNLSTDSHNTPTESTTGGTVQPSGEQLINKNTSTTLVATAKSGYTFQGWYNNTDFAVAHRVSTNASYTFTVTSDGNFYALFKQNTPAHYTLSVASVDNATVTATYNGTTLQEGSGTKSVPVGATVNYSISLSNGYKLDSSTPSGLTVGSGSFTMPASNTAVTISVSKITYNLTSRVTINNSTVTTSYGNLKFYENSTCTTQITTAQIGDTFYAKYTPPTTNSAYYTSGAFSVYSGTGLNGPTSQATNIKKFVMGYSDATIAVNVVAATPSLTCAAMSGEVYANESFTYNGATVSPAIKSGFLSVSYQFRGTTNTTGTFTAPSTAGTYTMTVIASNKPTDINTAATASRTVDIVVKYRQQAVSYYVDMHNNNMTGKTIQIAIVKGMGDHTILIDNDGNQCSKTLSKQGSSAVYFASINTPTTKSGSNYNDVNIMVTYNGNSYVYNLPGGTDEDGKVDDLVRTKEMWLEAENEASTPLTVNYSTRSTSTVPEGSRRIYLAKPYSWQNDEPSWENIGIYHWGNYTDIGWNAGIKMHYLGNSGSDGYHYYYADIPKAINGNKVSNIIFQGWGSNQDAGTYSKAQTGNIENIPDSANFYILSKEDGAFVGTKSEEDAVIANYTRYVSSVTMNKTETTAVNIKPTFTGESISFTSNGTGVVTVDSNGNITPVGRGTTTITVKIMGTIGSLLTTEDTDHFDYLEYPVNVTVKDPTQFNGFEIMSLESKTYTVNVPVVSGNQPGYFDMSNVVMTVEGIHGVTSSTSSAIITQTSTASVTGVGTVCTAFTVQYAKANSLFENYGNISIIGKVTTKSIRRDGGDRYGHDHWTEDGTTRTYTTSRVIDNGIETATTEGIPFDNTKSTYSDIFAAYQYVDVTFTFTYEEYNPQKVDVNNTPNDDSDDIINYFYDDTWAAQSGSHTTKTVKVSNYEVRGKTATTVQPSDLITPALSAIGVKPESNYYNYNITSDGIDISEREENAYTAAAVVNLSKTIRTYSVYLNGTPVGDNYTYQQYVEIAPTNQPSNTLWYAVDDRNSTDTTNAPLLATGSSYKFRVKGSASSNNTYLRTKTGTITDQNFNRSEVDFSHYEVTHQGSDSDNMKEYLMQNFYIADFFSPAKVLDPNSNNGQGNLPYDDAQFVGGGVVYYSMNGATENNQGTPFANAVSSGYVGNDGKINANAIKEMLKSNIEAQYAKDNIAGTVGEEDAMKAAYGTEIAATKNVEGGFNTGIIYRYLPLNQYKRDGSGNLETDGDGKYTLAYDVNKNTFRYSNSLQSYQYVYASGNENKATNAGKNMRLYSYYVYSYVTYDQETNVPVTKYEIVLSDNYSDASTYWEGNPNPDPSN